MLTIRNLASALAMGAAAVTLVAGPREAAAVSDQVRTACTDDYLRLCSAYDHESKRGEDCMRRNQHRLTRACRLALANDGYRIAKSGKR